MTYTLRYSTPAEDSVKGWEEQSLPLGCGWFGANVFGIPRRERIQITENSLQNASHFGGLNNLAELYILFPHADSTVTDYERGLRLNDGIAYTRYTHGGKRYTREAFTSYPDRALSLRLTGEDRTLTFTLAPEIPFLKEYARQPGDNGGKTGKIESLGENRILLSGNMAYYNIDFAAVLSVSTDGSLTNADGKITVENASYADIRFTCGTDYVLCERAFCEHDPKKKIVKSIDVPAETLARMDTIDTLSYDDLRARHTSDFTGLFDRVSFTLADADPDAFTDTMLADYREGKRNSYLETLYFQYGRYLLISSSRPGTLPANLQGTWNCHDEAPWGSGYWHNINVQMNYWPAFSTNLAETFEAYSAYNEAFRKEAARCAYRYLCQWNPENVPADVTEDRYADLFGWTIGTANYPYSISGPGGHSGPGTGGLTTKLFADWYDFTQDKAVLEQSVYPAVATMSRYLTRTVRDYDGEYLAAFSASPEQLIVGHWASSHNVYYNTVGCAFDQQMIWENGADLLRLAKELGREDADTARQREQQEHYSPVLVGWSGQIKEYREENLYGEIGEYRHRHISQLVGLFPGTLITSETPAWMDAAKVTLNERSDISTGWALAHRLNAWARTGDGNRAYRLYSNLLGHRTLNNLWDTHPPFQIDGNFGGTSGVAEMLLQSHEGRIAILPSLPDAWKKKGAFTGLCARGGFTISVAWEDGTPTEILVTSHAGRPCSLYYPGIGQANLEGADIPGRGETFLFGYCTLAFDTVPGGCYRITGIPKTEPVPAPANLTIDRETMTLSWTCEPGLECHICRAVDNDPDYTFLACGNMTSFTDNFDPQTVGHITYRVTARRGNTESEGVTLVVNNASKLCLERYAHILRQQDS